MKKIKYILTSLLTICLCFNVLKINTFAFDSTPTYYNTTHYQVTITSETFNGAGGYVYSMTKLSFNTKNSDPYKGIITLQYTYNANNVRQNLSNWDILCEGCTINSLNNTSGNFKIQTFGYTQFTVTLLYNSGSSSGTGVDNFNFSGMAESSVSVVTDPVETNTSSIDTKLTTTNSTLTIIQGKIDTANANLSSIITNTNDIETYLNQHDNGTYYDTDIETLLSGCKTQLTGIYNYITLNEALLNSIAGNIGSVSNVTNGEDIVTCINSIKNSQTSLVTNINNIYSLLGTVTQNQTSIINSLTSMGADISSIASTIASVNTTSANIYSAILSMKATLEGYEQYIDNIEGLISDQNNLINNLDNKLDTISWNNDSGNIYGISTTYSFSDTSIYDLSNITSNNVYIGFKPNTQKSAIYKVVLPFAYTYADYLLSTQLLTYFQNIGDIYVVNGPTSITLYYQINGAIQSSSILNLNIRLNSNARFYYQTGTQFKVSYIDDTDIEYWNLLSYFNEYNEYKRIYSILKSINDNQIDYTTYLNTINTLLTNINNAQHDYSSILNNIEGEVDGIEELLGLLTAALSIEGAGLFAEIGIGVQEIVAALSVTNVVDGVKKTIFDLINDLLDMTANFKDITENIDDGVGNIINSINRIDSVIDGITWLSYPSTFYGVSENPSYSDETVFTLDSVTLNDYYFGLSISNQPLGNAIYRIVIPYAFSHSSYIDNIEILSNFENIGPVYAIYYRSSTTIYFQANGSIQGGILNIHVKTHNNRAYYTTFTYSSNYILDTDIEYWNLLMYLNQYDTNEKILKGLLIDVDTETSIMQYNNDHETVTQIENDLTTLFNQTQPYVDSQLAPLDNQTFFDKLSNNSKLFDYIFRGVFDTDDSLEVSGTVTNPIFLLVIFAGVFLALVG